jgi:hypothetical protein
VTLLLIACWKTPLAEKYFKISGEYAEQKPLLKRVKPKKTK